LTICFTSNVIKKNDKIDKKILFGDETKKSTISDGARVMMETLNIDKVYNIRKNTGSVPRESSSFLIQKN
jgi:hypothetical protein